jgi:SAM-dependent MidA family methyltransferase
MTDVASRIRALVRREGPITFDRFMEEALYGPGGFYEHPPVGPSGHFVTSPHVHPVFSRLVGAAIEGLWEELCRPTPLRVIELGAGDGTMAREIVDGFGRGGIEIDYVAVERSPDAREALGARGIRAVEHLAQVERLAPGVVVANELLDNLPFRRVRRRDGELAEVVVGERGDRLIELEVPWLGAPPDPAPGEGDEALVPVGAIACVDELASSLGAGYTLFIDYGAVGGLDQVHGYRDHRLVADLLADPGHADVTAGVDLEVVAGHAARRGLTAFAPVTQRAALLALGLDQWSESERLRQADLLGAERGGEAVHVWDGRSRARTLADPGGLGRLRWLLLATQGLVEPPWLHRARELDPD